MSTPIVKGSSATHLHHTSGRVVSSDQTTKTIVQQGTYAALSAQVPRKGAKFQGRTVVSADLSPARGGMALLSVTVADSSASRGTGGDEEGGVTYEIEMAQLEKPILCHELFKSYAGQINAWQAADPALRAKKQYDDGSGNIVSLDGHAVKAAELMLKGVESYLVFAPVARRITRSEKGAVEAFGAVGADCGKIGDPPGRLSSMVAGPWKWLKTADRVEETSGGGSQRVEEWTGADEWDKDLYG